MTEIDEAVVAGLPQRDVAESYRVSHSALQRHASTHMSEGIKQAAYRREGARYGRLVARMAALMDEGEQVLRIAKERGSDQRLVLAAIRELRETLAAVAKVTQPQISDAETEALVQALARVLPEFPIVAHRLSEELYALGAEDAAEVLALAAQKYGQFST